MPSRIIKESICSSEDLNKLSPEAENLFYRLIVRVDDYGAYYGNPSLVKSACFPLRADDIKCSQVEAWLDELKDANLIYRYKAEDGRQYVQFVKWEKHQQIRAKKRKFPEYSNTCNQLISDDGKCSRNPIQSNPIQFVNDNKATKFSKPTVEEIRAYCDERKNGIDPVHFYDHYEAVGWKVGKNPMKDWKACVRTWERRNNGQPVSANTQAGAKHFDLEYDN